MSDGSSPIAGFVMLVVAFVAYFLPTFIAAKRGHPNGTGIFLLDLFLGWTFLGWLIALIWSVSAIKAAPAVVDTVKPAPDLRYSQLETLAALKEKGVLTEAEFEAEKAKLLRS
jgi:hypothetical protein